MHGLDCVRLLTTMAIGTRCASPLSEARPLRALDARNRATRQPDQGDFMRMLRVITCAAAATAIAMPQFVQAQNSMGSMGMNEAPAIGFGLLGGATFPVGDYNKAAATGFNIGGFVDFGRRLGPLGLRADVLYHGFGDKNVISTAGPGTSIDFSNKYSMVTGTLNGVFGIPLVDSPVRPYLTGGVGAYYIKNSPKCTTGSTTCALTGLSSNQSTTKFGLNGGAGIEFGLGGAAAFIESRFHQVFQGAPEVDCIGTAKCNRAALQIVPVNLGVKIQF
ncbi:MAG: outer membrane beta-barrel protein [Gemmatimonas sp.]